MLKLDRLCQSLHLLDLLQMLLVLELTGRKGTYIRAATAISVVWVVTGGRVA